MLYQYIIILPTFRIFVQWMKLGTVLCSLSEKHKFVTLYCSFSFYQQKKEKKEGRWHHYCHFPQNVSAQGLCRFVLVIFFFFASCAEATLTVLKASPKLSKYWEHLFHCWHDWMLCLDAEKCPCVMTELFFFFFFAERHCLAELSGGERRPGGAQRQGWDPASRPLLKQTRASDRWKRRKRWRLPRECA